MIPGKGTRGVGAKGSVASLAIECVQGSAADSSKHDRNEGFREPVCVCVCVCVFPHIANIVCEHCYMGVGETTVRIYWIFLQIAFFFHSFYFIVVQV